MSLPTARASLDEDLAFALGLIDRPAATADEIADNLSLVYAAIYYLDLDRYDPVAVRRSAPALIAAIFDARLRLRGRIAGWQESGLMTRRVQRAVRDVLRISRYGADMLGEIALGHVRLADGDHSFRGFATPGEHVEFYNAAASTPDVAFRSGDVLLVRGMAHNSAAIARIGDVDTQFSHMSMIYVDPAGDKWVVEALIEDGAVIKPLDEALDHNLGRAALYRHKDAELASRAAETIYQLVRKSHKGWGRRIPYDFTMRLKGRGRLFCSKLVHLAFKDASKGKVRVPAYMTRLDMENRDFFRRIGVRTRETFAPGDIDIDPSFDLVAEWQDFRVTSRLRSQDMVMTKFFEWMDAHNFKFREDLLIRAIALFGRLSGFMSDGIKDLISGVVPKVPRNMPSRTIATIVMLHKSAESVMPALNALEENSIRMSGRPLHPRQALQHLELLRAVSGGRIGYLVEHRRPNRFRHLRRALFRRPVSTA